MHFRITDNTLRSTVNLKLRIYNLQVLIAIADTDRANNNNNSNNINNEILCLKLRQGGYLLD